MLNKVIDHIEIRGARVNNLKNIDLDIPLRQLVCFSGPSGSGKTSIAFHTLLTESKRRFVNSFPNSLKFFTDRPSTVDVDRIFPVLPVFGLPQVNPVLGSRVVVSDVMRLTEALQNLFYSSAREFCPEHKVELQQQNISQQLKGFIQMDEPKKVYYLLVSKSDFQYAFGPDFHPSRTFSIEHNQIHEFNHGDDLWELLRFKSSSLDSLEGKLSEMKLRDIRGGVSLWWDGLKSPITLHLKMLKVCPVCNYQSTPVSHVGAFSPFSALGACKSCNGYGANLVYNEKKLMDRNLSVDEGALKLLNYGPFQDYFFSLKKVMKKKNFSTSTPLNKLPKEFFDILEDGYGEYPGYSDLKAYLESKKYRPSVRIYIRNLQKEEPCLVCRCSRLNKEIHHFVINFQNQHFSLPDIMEMSISEALELFKQPLTLFSESGKKIALDVREKLQVSSDMGLGHLRLSRKAKTLSAGEYQRLLLIKYFSFKGVDSLFVLDEPALGLGVEEQKMLLRNLKNIVKQGNTVIIIDHSDFLQKNADYLFVMGPGSGGAGGKLLFQGTPDKYFESSMKYSWPKINVTGKKVKFLEVLGAEIYGKRFNDFKLPINEMTWIHGPSGVGKTSAIIKILGNYLHFQKYGDYLTEDTFKLKDLKGDYNFEEIIVISSELNRFTSRSSVGTITDFSSVIRKHFLKLPMVKSMKLQPGHLSSNSDLGMCPHCEGRGYQVVEMQYLEDIVLECEECKGLKLKPIYAHLSDGHMTLSEAYNLPLNQVLPRMELTPKYQRIWEYLKVLNLDYLSLERSLNSLSGGEKQRIYLLSKLIKRLENSLIIFENLSFGLSEAELAQLGEFLHRLKLANNTIFILDSSHHFNKIASFQLLFTGKEQQLTSLIK